MDSNCQYMFNEYFNNLKSRQNCVYKSKWPKKGRVTEATDDISEHLAAKFGSRQVNLLPKYRRSNVVVYCNTFDFVWITI